MKSAKTVTAGCVQFIIDLNKPKVGRAVIYKLLCGAFHEFGALMKKAVFPRLE